MVKDLNVLDQEIEEYSFKARDYIIARDRENAKLCRDKVINLYIYKKEHYELDREERNTLKLLKMFRRGQDSKLLKNKLQKQIKKQ